ncbi:hypothetical protein Tco_0834564 [Tanacetum coccineum]
MSSNAREQSFGSKDGRVLWLKMSVMLQCNNQEDHFRGIIARGNCCSWECGGEQVTNFDDDVDDPPEKDLALNVDHIFELTSRSIISTDSSI